MRREKHAHNHNKMKAEEKFVGGLANRAQANDNKEGESANGKDSNLNELLVERSRFHATE